MLILTANEARVLGVLVEKAQTTPEQYPLTLNAATNGANQKNNRDPVMNLSDDDVLDALNALRDKKLVVRVDLAGSRVPKYRHSATDGLGITMRELIILAELLLRGPQTVGELRGRASRMHPLESMEMVTSVLQTLMTRPEPLVRELPPSPGSRAQRYVQLLSPDAHPTELTASTAIPAGPIATPSLHAPLADRVTQLEHEVATLRDALRRLAASVGEPDPLNVTAPPSAGT
ncbi:MAG TPA: YceH family protein [Tepidisphaeraceae bacterium]|jgi:uncharacterized protein YceH (UPF0502 family)